MAIECIERDATLLDAPANPGDLTFNGDHRVLQWCDGGQWLAAD
jgi:hypothetical protein